MDHIDDKWKVYKVDILYGEAKKKKKKKKKKVSCQLHAAVVRGICGKNVGVDFGRALPSRIYTHTHRDTRTYTRRQRETHMHQHIQSHASCHVRNFVRVSCRMLCALPVTRILNTKFNFFFLFPLPVCDINAIAINLDPI